MYFYILYRPKNKDDLQNVMGDDQNKEIVNEKQE